tara:strand:- start:57 stop:734 length:678 start_codon:yes stop_codon:yes gene_type:complete
MKYFAVFFLLFFVLVNFTQEAGAHPGRTDSYGCHTSRLGGVFAWGQVGWRFGKGWLGRWGGGLRLWYAEFMKHRIRVAAIIVDDNKILLVKHVHPETKEEWWVPPGGGIEEGDESVFECAKRETFEETNLKIESSRIVYIREYFDKEHGQLNIELFVLVENFTGKISIQNVKGSGPDEQYIKEVKWLSMKDINGITVYPEILKDSFWDDYKSKFLEIKYLGRQAS